MRHENSVFHQLQQHVPWSVFDKLVDEHKADHRVRRLNTKSQFLALLFGQLAGAASLREIEAGLMSQKARLYHVGGRTIARTTLADANARRPAAVFAGLFARMAATASRRTRRHMRDSVRLLDATRIKVSSLFGGWADMVGGARAIKVHLTYDPLAGLPMDAKLTGQKTNDILVGRQAPILPGVTYVFDLAYYDFRWWRRSIAAGHASSPGSRPTHPSPSAGKPAFPSHAASRTLSSPTPSGICRSGWLAHGAIPSRNRCASSPSS